jgi:predicted chitinase
MADNKPINWAYPFKAKGSDGEQSNGALPELYQQALAQAKDGFYPMGASGLWHGGVHFDEGTASVLDQSAIHCIADGEVVAYRIDERYPTSRYSEGPTAVHCPFSTGFVLVRHKLALPQPPTAGQVQNEGSDTTTAEALTFYSLYMHLLDWAGYSAPDAPSPPAFLGEALYSVKPDKATDPVLGLRVRTAARTGTVLALLPKGCKVRVGAAAPESAQWRRVLAVVEGNAIPALSGDDLGWVFTGEMDAVAGEVDTYLVGEKANDAEPSLAPGKGLNVRKAASGSSAKVGLLPLDAKFRIQSGTGAYRQLVEIVEGQDIAPLSTNSVQNIRGFVHFDSLQSSRLVPLLDKVQLLAEPQPIKAGELLGHIGKYQNFDDSRPRSLLHLEVFTCEDVPAFISKSRALAEQLPEEQKTLIKVHAGSSIIQPSPADSQIPAEWDVRPTSESPKKGGWAKVQRYAVLKADKSNLGQYSASAKRYSLSASQKGNLAAELSVNANELPDTADFLMEYYDATGGDPHGYSGGSIPTSHPMRKIGIRLGTAYWVARNQLNEQGGRRSTSGALSAWTTFPLQAANDGLPSGYDRILSGTSWSTLATEHKAIAPDNTRWWYVTVGGPDGQDISGWVPEIDPIISKHSPWEWPGFSTIQDQAALDAQLARNLEATENASEEESQNYAALIEATERGPILSKLHDIIDLPDDTGQRDGELTPAELKTALGKPWLAQQLSLLITQYESEWRWNEGKWNQLDKLMEHSDSDPNPSWVAEKSRIKTLSWWDELAGQPGIDADGLVWHFQPMGLLENFQSKKACCEISVEKFKSIFGDRRIFSAYNMPRDGNAFDISAEDFTALLNASFKNYNFDSCLHKAHFLAQCYHESDHFNTTIEYDDGMDYDLETHPATVCNTHGAASRTCRRHRQIMAEGNTTIGDGPKYKGRGLIQITWKSAYSAFSNYSGIDCIDNPEIIGRDMKTAISASLWYWTIFKGENLNKKIDRYYQELSTRTDLTEPKKDEEVVRLITKIVNGGDRGLSERQTLFKKIREQLK